MNARPNDELWEAVQTALDDGREPLEDPGVRARWGDATAHERDEVSRLLARLEALPAMPTRTARPKRTPPKLLAWAVAAALLALPFAALWLGDSEQPPREAPSAIYEAQLSVERQAPPPARLQRATLAAERHFTWNVAGETGRLEVH